jgi:hypothetical protein
MQKKVEKMITSLLPDAVPGVDFEVAILADGTAEIVKWDSEKLGRFPGLSRLREMYLKYIERRKKIMPDFDDSDPLPYMAEKPKETVRRMFDVSNLPKVEVINGVAFSKK